MRYRKLGDTGLWVSETGFGTIPILKGNVPVLPAYYNLEDDEALAVMEHAFQLGCNLYDTAIVPEYGDAEKKLGKFAAYIGREKIIISDKARFFDGNEMYQAVQCSFENLGTPADLYFVHQVDAEHEEAVFRKGGALDALSELKQEGKIGYAGVATHYYDILWRAALDPRVDVLQGSGNLIERGMLERMRAEPIFQRKGIIINKVYAAGLLPAFFPTSQLIQAVLSYPISSALIGVGTIKEAEAAFHWRGEIKMEEIPSNILEGTDTIQENSEDTITTDKIVRNTIPSFAEALSTLEREFSPIPCNRCQRCKCPYGTEIHTVFRQYNYYFLGKDHWALRKLDMGIRQSAEWCRKCTDMPCLAMCPAKIRIPDEIQKAEHLTSERAVHGPLCGRNDRSCGRSDEKLYH